MTSADEVEQLPITFLYRQSSVAYLSALVNAGIYGYLVRDLVSRDLLLGWAVFLVVGFVVRVSLQRYFNRNHVVKQRPFDPAVWENRFAIGAALGGLGWGMAGTLLFPQASIAHQAFLGFLLAGTAAGAAVAYSVSTRSVLAFLLPACLPFGVGLP